MRKRIALVVFVLLLSQWLQAGHLHSHDSLPVNDCVLCNQASDDLAVSDTAIDVARYYEHRVKASFYQSRISPKVHRLPTARAPPAII